MNHLHQDLFEFAPRALLVLHSRQCQWRVVKMNQAARRMFRQDMLDPIEEYFPDEYLNRLHAACQAGELLNGINESETTLNLPSALLSVRIQAYGMQNGEDRFIQLQVIPRSETILLEDKLQRRVRELSNLHEISMVLQGTSDLSHIFHVILTGVTFGHGLGFNRAFLLLHDPEQNRQCGEIAVGPSTWEEADEIWNDLNRREMSLREILQSYTEFSQARDIAINHLVRTIVLDHRQPGTILHQAFQENRAKAIERSEQLHPEDRKLLDTLQVDRCWLAPIIIVRSDQQSWRGVLVVDNMITGRRPITEDIESLEICARYLSLSLERFELVSELKSQISTLERLYQQMKENSNRLLYAEKLAAMGKVAARIAHEIKNPLVSIGGFANILKKKMKPDDPDYRYVSIIVDEVIRLENTLYSVLYFTNMKRSLLAEFPVSELIERVEDMFRDELERQEIDYQFIVEPESMQINADRMQLEQVLVNLIRNGIEAIGRKGEMRVVVTREDGHVTFMVEDTGTGLAVDDPALVFDSFFTTKSTGTGLGLTISREIIDNHGGRMWLENARMKGVQVYFRIPDTQDT